MRPLGLLGMLAAGLAAAQTAPPAASVSGVVKDAVSGQPLEGHTVSTYVNARWFDDGMQLSSDSREVSATTDAQGRYRLSGLPPGSYGISARHPQHFGQQVMRRVVLAGKDLEDIDFRMPVPGEIAGRVSDENGEPLPGITVFLVVREYHLGSLHYFFRGIRTTDDRGQYSFTRVAAGSSYLVLAEKRGRTIPARSQAPLNPKLRRRVPMRTWYPGAPSRESAQAVTVAPGERREGVDIEMRKSPSYCVSGVAEGATGPAALNFRIEPLQPSSGSSSRGGVYVLAPGGITDKDGRFRICDLFPGTYRLHADDSLPGSRPDRLPVFGAVEVTVADEDIR
ncbi:MAG: carboxypeptidase regulatory-like domain-containing protein, partial [Bryobacterales bacterium]|nr:carboxypeptidase regulatory-like domain-containing protein [Bryobacterales bacterium]